MLKIYSDSKERLPHLTDGEIEKIDIYIVYSQDNQIEEYIKQNSEDLIKDNNVVINGELLGLGAGPFHFTALFQDLYDLYVAVKDVGEVAVPATKGVIKLVRGLRSKGLARKIRFEFKKSNYVLDFCLRKHVVDKDADVAMQKMAVVQDEFRPKEGIHYVLFEFDATDKRWVVENEC